LWRNKDVYLADRCRNGYENMRKPNNEIPRAAQTTNKEDLDKLEDFKQTFLYYCDNSM